MIKILQEEKSFTRTYDERPVIMTGPLATVLAGLGRSELGGVRTVCPVDADTAATAVTSVTALAAIALDGSAAPTGAATATPRIVYRRIPNEIDVSTHWPLAFESGVWEGREGTGDGPVIIGGKFSAQWVKRDGRWLIRSEVFVALTCAGAGCSLLAVP